MTMSNSSDSAFLRQLITKIGNLGLTKARTVLGRYSFTLQKAVNLWVVNEHLAQIQVPHYWALYIHDGRQPFNKARGVMCWFVVPLQDPRLRGGVTPVRASQLRRLTKQEFFFWVQKNREAIARGEQPPMIITRRITKATTAKRFFENDGGMAGFSRQAAEVVKTDFSEYVRSQLSDLLNIHETIS